jgi:hypothetical protein
METGAFLTHSVMEDAAYFGSTSSRYGVISLAEVRSKFLVLTMKKKNKIFFFCNAFEACATVLSNDVTKKARIKELKKHMCYLTSPTCFGLLFCLEAYHLMLNI